ncbi:MAG: MurR/RpiR family transcriptional regulator [Rhizobiales bacterium]|nr:MurR/RpiR family transcriptional regulator [Hyphomicrobiales bacterium]
MGKGNGKASTIAEQINGGRLGLTAADRKLSAALMADYPVAGLASISDFARAAGVSTPSVLRFAKRLGFTGFPAFQQALRGEVSAQLQNPVEKPEQWSSKAPRGHILNTLADAAMENLGTSLRHIDHHAFDDICRLLGDARRSIHVMGGRITGHLAGYLHTHLQMARSRVGLVPAPESHWPQYLLEIGEGDILVVFDVRRYDARVQEFAASARQRGARIVLITDQWMSPVSRLAAQTLVLRMQVPSGWDSNVVTLFVVEAMVAAVVNQNWKATRGRVREIDKYFESGRRGRS